MRVQIFSCFISHRIVCKTLPIHPDAVCKVCFRAVNSLDRTVVRRQALWESKECEALTYGCEEYHIVICLELPETDLFVSQVCSQTSDAEPDAQQRECLGRERAAHYRIQLQRLLAVEVLLRSDRK